LLLWWGAPPTAKIFLKYKFTLLCDTTFLPSITLYHRISSIFPLRSLPNQRAQRRRGFSCLYCSPFKVILKLGFQVFYRT
jgi:hypothetical protein